MEQRNSEEHFLLTLFPKPSPLLAPFTRPATSIKDTYAGIALVLFAIIASLLKLSSGIGIGVILGSIWCEVWGEMN